MAENTALADFDRPFPNLMGTARKKIDGSFSEMARALAKSKRSGAIQFTIREGRRTRRWCLTLTPGDCHVAETAVDRPDLEIITSSPMWARIASGKLTPLAAFGTGQVRLRGSIELARIFSRRVAG